MSFILAVKAFFKAFKDPKAAEKFVAAVQQTGTQQIAQSQTKEDTSHIQFLGMLQDKGRLIDFLQEDIDSYDDSQVGAAAREVHRSCRECLKEYIRVKPVLDEREGAEVRIPKGYDANKIKVVGKVTGEPPYVGILVHTGWAAGRQSLPSRSSEANTDIICPAEVEIR